QTTSAGVNITVNNADTTPPVVSITSPIAGATVSGTAVTVSASASDNVGVVGVQFKLDGSNLGAETTKAPYSITWNTAQASAGLHMLPAVARDAAGTHATSAPVAVTVAASTSSGNSTFAYSLSDKQVEAMYTTDASAPMSVGYAVIQPDSGYSALDGSAI